MKAKLFNIIKYVFFLSIGIGLMIYIFKDLKITEIWAEAQKMNYSFFIYSSFIALFAHFFRAHRWKILIHSIGYQPKLPNVFGSILAMNFFNIIIPRSGEVARCGTLYKYEKIPVKKLLGTVLVERLFDLFSLMFFTAILFVVRFDIVKELYMGSAMHEKLLTLWNNKTLIIIVFIMGLGVLLTLYIFRKKLSQFSIFEKLYKLVNDAKSGLVKMLKTDQKLFFFLDTFLIWFMYFGMIYVCFFAYEPTKSLGPSVGYTMFIAGSFGMVAPTNGGVGAWHFMCMLGLSIFGINELESASFVNVTFVVVSGAVVIHGILALVFLPIYNRFMNKKEPDKTAD